MINFKTGDILTEDAEALVNTVNRVGATGRGIALQLSTDEPTVHHQLPDQASLAWQEPNGGYRSRSIKSIAIPPLGSGLGGLYWSDVRLRIEDFSPACRRRWRPIRTRKRIPTRR